MAKIKPDELYQMFQEHLQARGKEMTIQEIREVVSQPFLSLRKDMENDELYVYRFRYFGTFYVSLNYAKSSIVNLAKGFKNLNIDSHNYFRIKKMLEEYINRKEK